MLDPLDASLKRDNPHKPHFDCKELAALLCSKGISVFQGHTCNQSDIFISVCRKFVKTVSRAIAFYFDVCCLELKV